MNESNKITSILAAIALVLSLFALCSKEAKAWGNWMPEPLDKVAHVAAGAGLAFGGYRLCRGYTEWNTTTCSIVSGMVSFAVTGPLKEASDINWDNQDMAASGAGAVLGMGITLAF